MLTALLGLAAYLVFLLALGSFVGRRLQRIA
jgi:hypothetical protein